MSCSFLRSSQLLLDQLNHFFVSHKLSCSRRQRFTPPALVSKTCSRVRGHFHAVSRSDVTTPHRQPERHRWSCSWRSQRASWHVNVHSDDSFDSYFGEDAIGNTTLLLVRCRLVVRNRFVNCFANTAVIAAKPRSLTVVNVAHIVPTLTCGLLRSPFVEVLLT